MIKAKNALRIIYKRIFIVFLILLALTVSTGTVRAFASETNLVPSDVLSDLQKDASFNADDYPAITDSSDSKYLELKIIQIAESEKGELFIYTYQPAKSVLEFNVTTIAMWTSYSNNGKDFTPVLYDLELVSSAGVFSKFLVKDYTVTNEAERYYNISAIYREFNSQVDESISGGATSHKAIAVGQQWVAYYKSDALHYEMGEFETLDVDITQNGYVEFSNGITLGSWFGQSQLGRLHYVAFNVENYIVEHIFDADMAYQIREFSYYTGVLGADKYTDWEDETVRLKDTDVGTFDGQGLFSKDYKWNKISSSADFIANMEGQSVVLDENAKASLQGSQWVFAFKETPVVVNSTMGSVALVYGKQYIVKEISGVTILRLHFLDVNQKIYNLGVVADVTAPDDKPDGEGDPVKDVVSDIQAFLERAFADFWSTIKTILLGIAVLVVAVPTIIFIFPYLVKFIWSILKSLAKGIFYIVTSPYWIVMGIVKLFKKGS